LITGKRARSTISASGNAPVASFAAATQSTASNELGAYRPSARPLDSHFPNPASIFQRTLLRQTPTERAVCGKPHVRIRVGADRKSYPYHDRIRSITHSQLAKYEEVTISTPTERSRKLTELPRPSRIGSVYCIFILIGHHNQASCNPMFN